MDIIPPSRQDSANTPYQPPPEAPGPAAAPPGSAPSDKPSKNSKWSNSSLRSALSTIGLLLSAFVIAVLLNTFVIQSYQVDGQSMEPTLQNDDRLIVNKIPRTIARIDGHQYVPHRGDIIIFNKSNLPGFVGTKQLIKRVIGLPGDRVVVSDGEITIYNSAHPQGFNPDTTGDYRISAPATNGNVDVTLKSDELFVCGDNRGNSEDSRYFGPIKTNSIVAKLVFRILPLNKAQAF
ncbi:MAG TPA: signal peptidase I [Candidatus Saccharimonadales bacterium]|nr:signal peptidase I [Candidatus Saccharimonadales bacterium]